MQQKTAACCASFVNEIKTSLCSYLMNDRRHPWKRLRPFQPNLKNESNNQCRHAIKHHQERPKIPLMYLINLRMFNDAAFAALSNRSTYLAMTSGVFCIYGTGADHIRVV